MSHDDGYVHRVRYLRALAVSSLLLALSAIDASAHSLPQTMDPAPNARIDGPPQQLSIVYDSAIDPRGSSIVLLDASGASVSSNPVGYGGNRQSAVRLSSPVAPGPYTVAWTSVAADDGHDAHGFYTFVVNGGPTGILAGEAQAQGQAADLVATLTVMPGPDGGSVLRVDLDKTTDVERVRIRLARPDLGEDLLTLDPSGDGGWVLAGNEVAVPGTWQAQVIVRRANIFDDAQATFSFNVDGASGMPAFASAADASAGGS